MDYIVFYFHFNFFRNVHTFSYIRIFTPVQETHLQPLGFTFARTATLE